MSIWTYRYFKIFFYMTCCLLLGSCARPVGPTGGPPDKEGPVVVRTVPQSGTTNFSRKSVEFHFSEFINRSTLQNALTIEPDLGIEYKVDWGRKSVAIKFDRSLPDLTTIIITLGTDLKDMNGNIMSEPVKIAVSTGPEIDSGEIRGKVIDAGTGKGEAGKRVLLFRNGTGFEERANYAAQTDTSGRFRFSYLRQGSYKAIWVDDRNRNKSWDPELERAQPFSREVIELQKGESDSLGTLFIADSDTSAPNLQGIGLFSSQRLRIRFSENIFLRNDTDLLVTDSTGSLVSGISPLYIDPGEKYILFAYSNNPLVEKEGFTYRLVARNIEDKSGNLLREAMFDFEGSNQEDTTVQRVIRWENKAGLYPREPVRLLYAKPIQSRVITDSVNMVEGGNLFKGWSNTAVELNRLNIYPQPQWQQGLEYEVRVWNPKRDRNEQLELTVWHNTEFGGIGFSISDSTEISEYILELTQTDNSVRRDTIFTGRSFQIENLPPLKYQAVIFTDFNSNNQWDAGQVDPFRPPEPYFIRNQIPVRKGFISDVTVNFGNWNP